MVFVSRHHCDAKALIPHTHGGQLAPGFHFALKRSRRQLQGALPLPIPSSFCSGPQMGVGLPPTKGALVMSGDICGCHNWREGCSWYREGRHQRCYLTGESPPQRISLPWMLWVPRQRNPIPERDDPLSVASKLRSQCFQFWNKLRGKSFVLQTAGLDTFFFFLMPETSPIWPPTANRFSNCKNTD